MAYGDLNKKMDAAAESGKNLVSKHQNQPEYGDEQDPVQQLLGTAHFFC